MKSAKMFNLMALSTQLIVLIWEVNSRFGFAFASIDDLLNLVNFVVLELWEHFFDFESVHCCIRLLRFGRDLGIKHFLQIVSFLEKFGDLVDLLRNLHWNRWRDWRDVNRCDNLLTFVIGWSFGNLRDKFRFYLVPEWYFEVVHMKTILVWVINGREKFLGHFTHAF